MIRRICFALVAGALAACASPTEVTHRPGPVDLAGFITSKPDPEDLASPTQPSDMASSGDAAMPPAPADMSMTSMACGSITYAGTCTGNTLRFCNNSNQLQTIDCAAASRQCTTVAGDSDCRFVTGGPCGSVDATGECDGNFTLVYCDVNNKLVVKDCAGSVCVSIAGVAGCL